MKKDKKLALWSERIHDFQTSGQSCKAWCQENQIPVSTMRYWMRRLRNTRNSCETDLLFAKMPTEQEIAAKETANSLSPIHIFIADSIRIGKSIKTPMMFSNENNRCRSIITE